MKKKEEYTLDGGEYSYSLFDISSDGKFLAIGNCKGAVKVWNFENKTEEIILNDHKERVHMVKFSSDSKMLVSGSFDEIKIWNLELKSVDFTLSDDSYELLFFQLNADDRISDIFCMSLSPDGKLLALGYSCNFIKVWNLVEKKEEFVFTGHTDSVFCISFTPDGKFLADHMIVISEYGISIKKTKMCA